MISKIRVYNYQSLRNVGIELGKFTVIVGESECGKSAFIRSVLKATRNDAVSGVSAGEEWSHLPPNADNAEVVLELDGHKIRWTKGKSNQYSVDGAVLKKVGKGCPEEVQEVLKMREIVFDDKTRYHLNFHEQFDLPFLVNDSGSKVAKILGEITNVNILYAANRESSRLKSSTARKLTVREEDLKTKQTKIQEYKDCVAHKVRLNTLVQLRKDANKLTETYKKLQQYINALGRNSTALMLAKNKVDSLSFVPKISGEVKYLMEDTTTYALAGQLLRSLDNSRASQNSLSLELETLKELSGIDVKTLANDVENYRDSARILQRIINYGNAAKGLADEVKLLKPLAAISMLPVNNAIDNHNNVVSVYNNMTVQLTKVTNATDALNDMTFKLADAKKAYNDFVKDNPTCPICGNLLSEEHNGEEVH